MMKRILSIGIALLVALGAGWPWGASRRSDLNRALRIAELRDGFVEGRAAVPHTRLDIYSATFGEPVLGQGTQELLARGGMSPGGSVTKES